MQPTCPLCERELVYRSEHHLVPRSRRRSGLTVIICRDCHDAIHARFDNKELERDYASIEALRTEPGLATAFAWIAKQDPRTRQRTRMSNRRRR